MIKKQAEDMVKCFADHGLMPQSRDTIKLISGLLSALTESEKRISELTIIEMTSEGNKKLTISDLLDRLESCEQREKELKEEKDRVKSKFLKVCAGWNRTVTDLREELTSAKQEIGRLNALIALYKQGEREKCYTADDMGQQIEDLQRDVMVLKGFLGEAVPSGTPDALSDGSIPVNYICDHVSKKLSALRAETREMAEWVLKTHEGDPLQNWSDDTKTCICPACQTARRILAQ